MKNLNKNDEHPAIVQLREKALQCKEELLKILDDWYYFQLIVQPRIIFEYESLFGDLECEIFDKSKVSNELERKVEIFSQKIKVGERINEKTIHFVNSLVEKEIKIKDNIQSNKINSFSNNSTKENNSFKRTVSLSDENQLFCTSFIERKKEKEIPHLYRSLVKKLHPDVSAEDDNFKKYWQHIQEAYKSKNFQHLKIFHQTLCDSDKEYPSNTNEEISLRNEIRELEKNIATEKRNFQQFKEEEPFVYLDKLNDSLWIIRRKRKLREKIFQIDRQIQYNKRLLRMFTGRTEIAKSA